MERVSTALVERLLIGPSRLLCLLILAPSAFEINFFGMIEKMGIEILRSPLNVSPPFQHS